MKNQGNQFLNSIHNNSPKEFLKLLESQGGGSDQLYLQKKRSSQNNHNKSLFFSKNRMKTSTPNIQRFDNSDKSGNEE